MDLKILTHAAGLLASVFNETSENELAFAREELQRLLMEFQDVYVHHL
jgi:hypothetical protein